MDRNGAFCHWVGRHFRFSQHGIGFVSIFLFLVGHILWFKAGFDAQDKTLIALNGMYIPFDLYAIVLRPDFL